MNKITEYYNNEGYITTFAYLPAQKIQGGILKIAITEGTVSKINVKVNKWAKEGFLRTRGFILKDEDYIVFKRVK